MRDEAERIRAAARGDRRSFDELVEAKREKVVRTAYRVLGDLEDARDVAQQVFLTLWRSLDAYDPRRRFDTWLYRVTVNAAIDHLRSRGSRPDDRSLRSVPEHRTPRIGAVGDRSLRAREIRDAFADLSRGLPPQQRAAFVLREIEGLATREVAEILEVTESTVRNHLLLARRALRRGLTERYPGLVPTDGDAGEGGS